MRKILGIAAIVVAALAATPAMALETGQCLPAAQVRTALAAESMQPVIVGTRTGYGYPTSLIFFANVDGSRGYLIRGDKPLGQQSDTACVDSVYRDVRLHDVTRNDVPSWAEMPNLNAKSAAAICARGGLGYQDDCHFYGDILTGLKLNRGRQRLMFQATGTAINPRDHSIRTAQRLFITVDPTERGGLITASTAEGASYMLSAYTSASYTQQGSAMLDAAPGR